MEKCKEMRVVGFLEQSLLVLYQLSDGMAAVVDNYKDLFDFDEDEIQANKDWCSREHLRSLVKFYIESRVKDKEEFNQIWEQIRV